MTTVGNIRDVDDRDPERRTIDCRRKRFGMHYGNPASHLPDAAARVRVKTRIEAIKWFDEWLDGKHPEVEPVRRQWILMTLHTLVDAELLCVCFPLPCHCDHLARRANQLTTGSKNNEADRRTT